MNIKKLAAAIWPMVAAVVLMLGLIPVEGSFGFGALVGAGLTVASTWIVAGEPPWKN